MKPNQKDIHASHGKWSCRRDAAGNALVYTAEFTESNAHHALGAAKHLYSSGIMSRLKRHNKLPTAQDLKRPDGSYVIRLEREWGDDLYALKRFLDTHNLPVKEEVVRHRRAASAAKAPETDADHYSLAFRPAPVRVVRGAIDRLNWKGAPGAEPSAIFTETNDPMVAFQVAFYLRKNDYISEQSFRRINSRVIGCNSDRVEPIQITIPAEKFTRFSEQFPHAGEQKPRLPDGWLKEIRRCSAGQNQESEEYSHPSRGYCNLVSRRRKCTQLRLL